MRTFVLVYFWVSVSVFIIRCLAMAFETYPKQKQVTLSEVVASLLLQIAWLVWAGLVLWIA